jgi:chemotaxis protein methyltransferase CheR
MSSKHNRSEESTPSENSRQTLRHQAEDIFRAKASHSPENLEDLSPEEIRQMLHELRVHQIELEMQNEELRLAQAELDAARARYFDLYDLAPVGYFTVNETGLILEANLTAATQLGCTRNTLVKMPITRFILKEDQDIYYRYRKRLVKTGMPQECDLRMLENDGTMHWAHLAATVVQDADGASVGRIVMSDITERKRAEDELRESEDRFRKLFKGHSAPKLVIDSETGAIIDANEASAQFYGWPVEELKQMRIQQISLLSPEDVKAEMKKIVSQGAARLEFRHRRADGSIRDVEVFCNKIEIAGKTPLYAIIHDITERKKLEVALHKAHDKLEQQVAERTCELVAAMKEVEKGKENAETALSEIQKLKKQLEAERAYLIEEIKLENNYGKIIGQSDGLKYVLYKAEQIAGSDTSVLVLGETGTGKELVARAIHGLSPRKSRALVKVNCAALPSNLIESELFGHEKGAYTGAQSRHLGRFEVANGATLFLDEIGELPLELQSKMLRVLQDGEFERLGSSRTIKVDVRIIAATNRNLEEEVRKDRFREDLWYRLNVFPITMPPLRDRMDDVPLLVEFYVKKISKRMGKTIEMIPASVMNALQDYHWPGNVRELENVLERAVINSSGPKLRLADELKKQFKGSNTSPKTLAVVERDHIIQTLEQAHWKVGGKDSASEILGLDRSTLRARMRKLCIQKP